MHNHDRKESRIEPRERAPEPRDQAPAHGEEEVTRIVDLARVAVPAVGEDRIARLGRDRARVGDGLPGQLGEGFALDHLALFGGAEAVLLRVGRVPYPVHEEVGDVETGEEISVPAVG